VNYKLVALARGDIPSARSLPPVASRFPDAAAAQRRYVRRAGMRTFLRAVSLLLLVVGALAGALATAALGYSWLVPVQPPPSLNEGPGTARLLGWILFIPSAAAVIVGIAMHLGLNASRPPDDVAWTREHKRLW